MKYYPVFMRVAGQRCVVIGGGLVAEQKIRGLQRAGARVTIISPEITSSLSQAAKRGEVEHICRPYRSGDLDGATLAFAATDDEELHRRIAGEAQRAGIPLNVVDRPQLCSFIVPAMVQRGDLLIATSTSGNSPAMAKQIRKQLESQFGPEYGVTLQILGRVRQHEITTAMSSEQRQRMLGQLAESSLVEYVRTRRSEAINELLRAALGADVSLDSLGVALA